MGFGKNEDDQAGGVQVSADGGHGHLELVVVFKVPGDGVRAVVETFCWPM